MRTLLPFLLFTIQLHAQVIQFGKDTETITVVYGGPTIVHFPMEVKTVSQATKFSILPADEQQPNYAALSVTPRFTSGSDDVTFILSDGTVMHAKLVIVKKPIPKKTDSFYELKTKDTEVVRIKDTPSGDDRLSELELLKAMANSRRPRGYRVSHLSKDINLGISGVKCRLVDIYNGSEINGFVFEIENESDRKIYIDLTKLSFESDTTAVLSQIDRDKLSKSGTDGSKTLLRVISRGDSLNDLLPIAPIDDK